MTEIRQEDRDAVRRLQLELWATPSSESTRDCLRESAHLLAAELREAKEVLAAARLENEGKGRLIAAQQKLRQYQIQKMVDRFLVWELPEDFSPDAGISFKRTFNEHTAHPDIHRPVGTNLFTATQAEAMIRHMIEGMQPTEEENEDGYECNIHGPVCSDPCVWCRLEESESQVTALRAENEELRKAVVEMEARFQCAPEGYIHCIQALPDLAPLAEEMVRARSKFPGPRLLGSALAEEVGEMADAWLKMDPAHCRKEALQVACVAMRIHQEGNVGHGQSLEVLKLMAALEAPARANLEAEGADKPIANWNRREVNDGA